MPIQFHRIDAGTEDSAESCCSPGDDCGDGEAVADYDDDEENFGCMDKTKYGCMGLLRFYYCLT